MVNKIILIGNLGKDPEVKHLESGIAVAKFSIATSESYKDKSTGLININVDKDAISQCVENVIKSLSKP